MFRRARRAVPRGTYTEWWWPELPPGEAAGYPSFAHVLLPEVDPGPNSTYFWAHQFRTVAGEGGYLGLQTDGHRADGSVGKMAIFSFWDTLGAEGAGVVRFGGEGTGWSCRIPYPWEPGRAYRLEVGVVERDDAEWWWAASVADVSAEQATEIGRIRAPAAWRGLGTWSIMWTEYYGALPGRCGDMPYSRVLFSTPTADEGRVAPRRWRDHLGEGTCDTSRVTRLDGGVRHEVGMPEAGDE